MRYFVVLLGLAWFLLFHPSESKRLRFFFFLNLFFPFWELSRGRNTPLSMGSEKL